LIRFNQVDYSCIDWIQSSWLFMYCLDSIKLTVPLLLWKASLNSDDHQFYQYQQNELSPFTSNHCCIKHYFSQIQETWFMYWLDSIKLTIHVLFGFNQVDYSCIDWIQSSWLFMYWWDSIKLTIHVLIGFNQVDYSNLIESKQYMNSQLDWIQSIHE
jgi:uncharacterized protein YbdZ (MbtH family)